MDDITNEMVDSDASTHRAHQESAPPDIVLQMVTSVALTMLGEVLGSSLTGKLLAGALGAFLGAFLTARGSHHTRRIVAVTLLLALLDALRGAANALATTRRPEPADWLPRRPTVTLVAAVTGFAVGTGTLAVAHGLKSSTPPIHVTTKAIYARLPDVIGRDASKATAILATHGFAAAIHRQTGLHGTGRRVLDQSPSPGESKPRGSTVVLTVASSSSDTVSALVPSVVGLPVQQAIGRLEGRFGTKLVRVASRAPNDLVLTQAPQAGASALLGSVILLTVSRDTPPEPPPHETVPALAGLTVEGATARLKAIGLSAGLARESSEKVPSGIVIGSTPAASASVEEGSTVTLTISIGRPE